MSIYYYRICTTKNSIALSNTIIQCKRGPYEAYVVTYILFSSSPFLSPKQEGRAKLARQGEIGPAGWLHT